MLKSNKAIHIHPEAIYKEGNKENVDVSIICNDEYSTTNPLIFFSLLSNWKKTEFSELEFDESILKDVEAMAGALTRPKIPPPSSPSFLRPLQVARPRKYPFKNTKSFKLVHRAPVLDITNSLILSFRSRSL